MFTLRFLVNGKIVVIDNTICQNVQFGIWNLEFGIWNLEFGIWNLEFGIWNCQFAQPNQPTTNRRRRLTHSSQLTQPLTVSELTTMASSQSLRETVRRMGQSVVDEVSEKKKGTSAPSPWFTAHWMWVQGWLYPRPPHLHYGECEQ